MDRTECRGNRATLNGLRGGMGAETTARDLTSNQHDHRRGTPAPPSTPLDRPQCAIFNACWIWLNASQEEVACAGYAQKVTGSGRRKLGSEVDEKQVRVGMIRVRIAIRYLTVLTVETDGPGGLRAGGDG